MPSVTHTCIGGIARTSRAASCPFKDNGCPGGPDSDTNEYHFGQVRPKFVLRMRTELETNSKSKGDWGDYFPGRQDGFQELQHHVTKLYWALSAGDRDKTAEHCGE